MTFGTPLPLASKQRGGIWPALEPLRYETVLESAFARASTARREVNGVALNQDAMALEQCL